jgi:hypothetical protein
MTFIHNHGRSRSALHRLAWERTTQGRHPHPVPRGLSFQLPRLISHCADPRDQAAGNGCLTGSTYHASQRDWKLILLRGSWCCHRALVSPLSPLQSYAAGGVHGALRIQCSFLCHVMAPHPQRRGLFVTRHRRSIASEMINGIRLASAAETLLAAARDLGLLDRDLPALLWLGFERRSDGSRSDDVEGDRRAFGRWGTRAGSGVDNEVDSRAVNANPLHLDLEAGFAHHLPSRG